MTQAAGCSGPRPTRCDPPSCEQGSLHPRTWASDLLLRHSATARSAPHVSPRAHSAGISRPQLQPKARPPPPPPPAPPTCEARVQQAVRLGRLLRAPLPRAHLQRRRQQPVHHQVGVAPDGGREVRVGGDGQRVVPGKGQGRERAGGQVLLAMGCGSAQELQAHGAWGCGRMRRYAAPHCSW